MKKILIPTMPDDTHALYVKLALEKMGHHPLLWYTADIPQRQCHSFSVSKHGAKWNAKGVNFEVNDDIFDVVWMRRAKKPQIPDDLHVDDKANAENENLTFFKNIWQSICPNAYWVNPVNSIPVANSKINQLKVAHEVGFNVPNTLVSNDPCMIREFISDRSNIPAVYKTLYPTRWQSSDAVHLTYTSEINLDDLPTDQMIMASPGIFQKKIEKAFELRVTFFGKKYIAVKLNSQSHPKGIMDWRYVPTMELSIEEYALPDSISRKCVEFMQKMNLVFGCFDFIVTPDDEYYFLEINEQGQFIWIEHIDPSIKMLQTFCQFLVGEEEGFDKSNISVMDYINDIENLHKEARYAHVNSSEF